MRPITSEERQHFWDRLDQNLSFEGRLYTTSSIIDELAKSDIAPSSLDGEVTEKIRGGLAYVSNVLFSHIATNNTALGPIATLRIWHATACNVLGAFDTWHKGNKTPSSLEPCTGDHSYPDDKNLMPSERSKGSYFPVNELKASKTITKVKLADILHGNKTHSGYHTKSWFYYFFACCFGLSNRRSSTILALFALLEQEKDQFDEQDIKNAIISPANYDSQSLRRFSLFEGNCNKNGSSTDDIIEELRMAFNRKR